MCRGELAHCEVDNCGRAFGIPHVGLEGNSLDIIGFAEVDSDSGDGLSRRGGRVVEDEVAAF